jgi:ParB/RepB/Spo0J family partition protein
MAITTAVAGESTVPLDEIHVADNVGALDVDHVHALAGSIRLQGMLVPVVVRPAEGDVALGGWKYELVAGFHRMAAAAELRLTEIPAVVRAASREAAADRALENITRLQLSATEPRGAGARMAEGQGHSAGEDPRAAGRRPGDDRRRQDRALARSTSCA